MGLGFRAILLKNYIANLKPKTYIKKATEAVQDVLHGPEPLTLTRKSNIPICKLPGSSYGTVEYMM